MSHAAAPYPLVVLPLVVLVVEDEPLQRLFAIELLEDAGFTVLDAPDAAEAVRLLESRSDIAAVFADIDLPPGPSGLDLAARIHDRWPPIGIVVTSGKPLPRLPRLPEGSVFHAKPYRQERVIAALHTVTG